MVIQVEFRQMFSHQKFCVQYEFIIIPNLQNPSPVKPSKTSTYT